MERSRAAEGDQTPTCRAVKGGQGKVTREARVYDRRRKPALFTLLMLSFQLQAPALFFPNRTFLLPLLHLPKLGLHRKDNIDFGMRAATQ